MLIVIVGELSNDTLNFINENPKDTFYIVSMQCNELASNNEIPYNVTLFNAIPFKAFYHRQRPMSSEEKIAVKFVQYSDEKTYEALLFLRTTDEEVLYICDPTHASNIYELAALVKTETFENKKWFVGENIRLSLVNYSYIHDFFSDDNPIYPISSGGKTEDLPNQLFKYGTECVRAWLRAEYHLLRNVAPIPGSTATPYGAWLSLVISMNKLIPSNIDKNQQMEFTENPDFRKTVTDISVKTLSKIYPQVKNIYDYHEWDTLFK